MAPTKAQYEAAARVVERMRDETYQRATVQPNDDARTEYNRRFFRDNLAQMCRNADTSRALETSNEFLWTAVWTKLQYTQLPAAWVNSTAIPSMEQIPDMLDPDALCGSAWDIVKVGRNNKPESFQVTGDRAVDYLSGKLSDGRYHKATFRLHRLVNVARQFSKVRALAERDGMSMLHWIDRQANGKEASNRQLSGDQSSRNRGLAMARYFGEHLSTGGVTALHVLMDFGVPVIKPDTWIFRLIGALGLGDTKSPEEAVAIAGRIAEHYRAWNQSNPLRELDMVMVKFAQDPGPTEGIVKPIETDETCPVTRLWMQEELARIDTTSFCASA